MREVPLAFPAPHLHALGLALLRHPVQVSVKLFLVHATARRCSVVLGNLDDDDFVPERCLPDPMWSVLPHVVMEADIACKQQVWGTSHCRSVVFQTRNV